MNKSLLGKFWLMALGIFTQDKLSSWHMDVLGVGVCKLVLLEVAH